MCVLKSFLQIHSTTVLLALAIMFSAHFSQMLKINFERKFPKNTIVEFIVLSAAVSKQTKMSVGKIEKSCDSPHEADITGIAVCKSTRFIYTSGGDLKVKVKIAVD